MVAAVTHCPPIGELPTHCLSNPFALARIAIVVHCLSKLTWLRVWCSENRCGRLPLCHYTDGTVTEAPNVTAMLKLIQTFRGFGDEFSDRRRNQLHHWNSQQTSLYRAELGAAAEAAWAASHPEAHDYGNGSWHNGSWHNESLYNVSLANQSHGRRQMQFEELPSANMSSANMSYELLVAQYGSVQEFCAHNLIDENSTAELITICNNTEPVYEEYVPEAYVDASALLCRGDTAHTKDFVVQSNMINPAEHCNAGWRPDVCLGEGKTWTYTVRFAQAPASNVTLTVSGKFLQANVSVVFTPEDFDAPHNITVFIDDNMAITGHAWMELVHTFAGGVQPVAEQLLADALGENHPDHICSNRSKYHCADPATAWSHARVPNLPAANMTGWLPHSDNMTGMGAWVPGRLWSSTTNSYYSLRLPVLILDNDKFEVHPYLGETGRKFQLDSRVEAGQPAWRGPFTLGPSFFSANTARCPDGKTTWPDQSCLDGAGWDKRKRVLTTARKAYPPAPPLVSKCTLEECSETGEDPGYWTHDARFGLQDVAFRIYGPLGSVDKIPLKHPQNIMYVFRPCYVEPPGLPANFYELNGIKCPELAKYHLTLKDDEEAPAYPSKYAGATQGQAKDPLCLWSTICLDGPGWDEKKKRLSTAGS